METNQQLTQFLTDVDALATPEAKIASLKGAINTLFGEKETGTADLAALQAKFDELEKDEADTASKYSDIEDAYNKVCSQASALQKEYDTLQSESEAEIERLSKELSFTANEAGKSMLSVEVGGLRYVTPAGRKYNLKGKEVAAEDLVKDVDACKALIDKKSGVFKLAAE